MHPEINLSDYKATAVIDWLDIVVTLEHTTQFRYVQAELHRLLRLGALNKPVHVTAQGVPNPNSSATGFVFRLQEHHHDNNAAKIAHVVRGLAAYFGFAAPARIVGIEVSFDLRPKNDPKAIYAANAALQYGIAAYGEHVRQFAPSVLHKGRTVSLAEDPVFDPQGTLYEGHQDDKHGSAITAVARRGYPKKTDGQDKNKKPIPLPPSQHRARMEVTLQLEALEEYGLTDPLALASYDFTKLADLLHFRRLKPVESIMQASRNKLATDLREAISAIATTGRPTSPEKLSQLRWRVKFNPVRAAALASLARNTDRVMEWQGGWCGSEGRALQHSKDTTPDAKLNRKVKAALEALSKTLDKGIYPSTLKERAKTR